MIEMIAMCKCGGMKNKAEAAFKISFPNQAIPQEFRGRDAITKAADLFPGTNLSRYLGAVAKKHGRFAHYLKTDDDYNVVLNYDLMAGKNVA